MKRVIQIQDQLFLTVRAVPASQTSAGAEALLHSVETPRAMLDCGGWRIPLADDDGSVELYGDLAAYAFAQGHEDARRKIQALTTFLDLHADRVDALHCVLEAAEIGATADARLPHLTVRWCRADAVEAAPTRRSNVVQFPIRSSQEK